MSTELGVIGGVGAAVGGVMILESLSGSNDAQKPEIAQAKLDDKQEEAERDAQNLLELGRKAFEQAGLTGKESPGQAQKLIEQLMQKNPAVLEATFEKIQKLGSKLEEMEGLKEKFEAKFDKAMELKSYAGQLPGLTLKVGGAVVVLSFAAAVLYKVVDPTVDAAKSLLGNVQSAGHTAQWTYQFMSWTKIAAMLYGAYTGGTKGAAVGSVGGPWGSALGGVAGVAIGGYGGYNAPPLLLSS